MSHTMRANFYTMRAYFYGILILGAALIPPVISIAISVIHKFGG